MKNALLCALMLSTISGHSPASFEGNSDKVHGQGDIYANGSSADIGDFEATVTGNTLILTVDGEQVDFSWEEGPLLGDGYYASDSWMLPLNLLTLCIASNVDGCYRWSWVLQVQNLNDGSWVSIGNGEFVKS